MVRLIIAIITIFVLAIMSLGVFTKPTGYLHSWNQVTTLAVVQQLAANPREITSPKDVTTRIGWIEEQGLRTASPEAFIFFEEFPLYQLIAARLSKILGSFEVSSRLVSILFWALGVFGFVWLTKNCLADDSRLLAVGLYLTSWPIIFYGQAIMSDMALLAMLIAGIGFVDRWLRGGSRKPLLLAGVCFALAGLFKSYAVIIFPFIFLGALWPNFQKQGKRVDWKELIAAGIVAIGAIAPVLLWHGYAFLAPGHQDAFSHSLRAKILSFAGFELYRVLWKTFFRYVGYLPGALSLYCAAWMVARRKKRGFMLSGDDVPWWVPPWLVGGGIYAVITIEKLIVHDYYFLPIIPPIFVLVSLVLVGRFRSWFAPDRSHAVVWACAVLLALNVVFAYGKCAKAFRENPDVDVCADLVRSNTIAGELIATWTDIFRYNSVAFYSGRRTVTVEGEAFMLERYRQVGATKLLIVLPQDRYGAADSWLKPQLSAASPRAETVSPDAKGIPYTCALWLL